MTAYINDIVVDTRNMIAAGVSDDSFKDEFGTSSYILEDTNGSQSITGNVLLLPGFKSDQSANMSEISGIYDMVMVVELIKELWKL